MNKIHIIGVGLIGGSFALGMRKQFPNASVYGIDNNERHLQEAIDLNIIDKQCDLNDIQYSDFVILAIPVDASLNLIPEILNIISDNTLVIDVGSTKYDICKAIDNHPKRRNFLATHPIAGTEFSGPKAAFLELLRGKTNIICEVEKTAFKLQEKAIQLFLDLGMRLCYMNPESHDKHIAYVSHLSHISSFMLGKTVIEKEKNERDIFDMAGSGFESTVRLAKSSPEMWTPIFRQNKANVIETLEEYINNLNKFKNFMENDNFEAIYDEMKTTNYIKEILQGINS